MSSYRHLIVCAILFFVLFYGSANFAKAESIPTNCDYNHVVTLFGAVAIDYWYQPTDPIGDMPDLSKEPVHVFQLLKNSTLGLPYDSDCNLFETMDIPFSIYPPSPLPRLAIAETIDMRDVAQAIRNYQKSQST